MNIETKQCLDLKKIKLCLSSEFQWCIIQWIPKNFDSTYCITYSGIFVKDYNSDICLCYSYLSQSERCTSVYTGQRNIAKKIASYLLMNIRLCAKWLLRVLNKLELLFT